MASKQTTLDELSHLLINPSRLTILNDSEVGSGGYGEVYLATLDGTSKVAIKQLRIIPAGGTKARAAIVSHPPFFPSHYRSESLSAPCKRAKDMGESKAPECTEARRLLLERQLQLRPACIPLHGKWKYHRLYEKQSGGNRDPTKLCELTHLSVGWSSIISIV